MKHAVGDDARNTRSSSLALPILGVAIAIAGTTTMDATGLSDFSAFALLPLMLPVLVHRAAIAFRNGIPLGQADPLRSRAALSPARNRA